MTSILEKTSFDTWPGKLVRKLRRRYNDRVATILTYHSIARHTTVFNERDQLCHSPTALEREVDYLADNFNVMRLSDLIACIERNEMPRRAVVLTFDDGYADNLSIAQPILFRRRLPMTIFPVTSVIGNRDLLWQHKLAWLVRERAEERVWIALQAEGWDVPAVGEADLETFVRQNYRADVPDILEAVIRTMGTTSEALAAKYRPYLEVDDLAQADPEFVEFGNHTDTHPVLSALADGQQMVEIGAASRKLHEWTGRAPTSFAYPFGLKAHYTARTKDHIRATGHKAILDMRRRMNVWPMDAMELSRKPGAVATQEDFERSVEDWPANSSGAPPMQRE